MNIELSLPKNITEKDLSIFLSIKSYFSKIPRLKQMKNAFVTYDGLVLKNLFLVKRSAYNLSGFQDINFYIPYWKIVVEKYLVSKYGSSIKSKVFKEKSYAIVHSKWFNYAFWMNDSIYRCILLEKQLNKNDFILLLPSNLYQVPFVKETLSVFDFQIELVLLEVVA